MKTYGRMLAMLAVALPLAGCLDVVGLGSPRVTVSLYREPAPGPSPELRAWIGGKRVDVPPVRPGEYRSERVVHGPRYGTVPVRVVLFAPEGDTLATAEFTQDFARGHLHWVSGNLLRERPVGHCTGEIAAVPLRTGTDSLFVTYGSIPNGAIC